MPYCDVDWVDKECLYDRELGAGRRRLQVGPSCRPSLTGPLTGPNCRLSEQLDHDSGRRPLHVRWT